MNRLSGKTALITGGTSGIGLVTAQRFIEEGARVAVTGSSHKGIDAARATLGEDVIIIQSDAGNVADQGELARQLGDAFGTLDIAFLNAGVADLRPIEAWDEAGFDRSLAVDLKGPYFLVQALLPILANPASIVLSGSINAHLGMPTTSIYAAAKAGMVSLARTLSGELIGRGVRVNVVSPGPIDTPLNNKLGLDEAASKERAKAVVAMVPSGRFGTPLEVANAVLFLASDEARFVVGSELIIDGGLSIL
ncbi:NAD(P)-dependent dehydrogenase, short-chain alcohol dehydrogenase family [Kaistia soli DSM 19436]|uniref:NAD(P)-dependent dehydrogenase, short-chain alcohol dehydrogenase family n=1 Tax=Kaistia soli DSM 19436 TaxID=1122133 RepID=A0A1M5A3W9_9HYPH|nr:SDR family oxidoreductase [Kaistia soli]SHF24971.1 NAD(P)-dependent dehydrogenase, short-chain alcohol dehydrogenase family [Kaistia soli DSM 19436]